MAQGHSAGSARKLPLLLAAVGLAFGVPSAGLAVAAFSEGAAGAAAPSFAVFTPSSVDPQLARRVAQLADSAAMRFTPAGGALKRDRTVTVAVRVDGGAARAIAVRSALEMAPGGSDGGVALASTRFNLGTARGYQSFKRPDANVALSGAVRDIAMPDLATFKPVEPGDKPSRFQPRIALEGEQVAGRSPNTLDSLSAQTVDVGGAFRLTQNLDLTAGVRLSQE
ncbi:MAG: hypothetical protein ACO25F_09515, partial [Erythrobacter sp.]